MSEPIGIEPPNPHSVTLTSAPDAGAAREASEIIAPPGYELLAEIGRGGMGVVFRARDLELGREVAVKILQPHYAPNSTSGHRFVEEARITGRLQHPGIPAIYRVGTLSNGLPFLAMKLIGGRTLDELLKERTDRAADRGRFLAVFEQVAQAVGYAHKESVIHRDLKPSNVMVGAFGEVQVMDWGLAKSGDRRPTTDEKASAEPSATVEYTPHAALGANADATLAGAVLGTPAYMPPEQAIGAIDQIGKPSDVFGLGAILCVILTGEAPYVAETIEATRQLAARAKQAEAVERLDACGAEPDLVSLAKRCLAPEPADRPRDAGEVATAVAALRAEAEQRARQAEMDRARAEVKTAEERKRRRVQRVLALAVIGLLAVAGYTARRIDNEQAQRRTDQRNQQARQESELKERQAELHAQQLARESDVLAALNEVQVLREQGWKQEDDPARWALTIAAARPALNRAERLGVAGDPRGVFATRLSAAQSGLTQDERDRALLAELDRIADGNEVRFIISIPLSGVTSRKYATAFRTHGVDLLTVPIDEAIAWIKEHRLRNRLAMAIRNWQQSYPSWEVASVIDMPLFEAVVTSAAVAGYTVVMALIHAPNKQFEKMIRKLGPHARLSTILNATTDDPFTKEWWAAAARRDMDAFQKLIARPELRRLSSRELSSLADALNPQTGMDLILGEFLEVARDRFPGEFWIHFRLAMDGERRGLRKKNDKPDDTIRHLTAAVAARPSSAVARTALGMELMDKRKNDPEGPRMIRSAAEVDPTSPWPHYFLGMTALKANDWPAASRSLVQCVQADPDTGFFMIYATTMYMFMEIPSGEMEPNKPTDKEIMELIHALIAARPDHPGGYDLHATYLAKKGEPREALALYGKAKMLTAPDYPGRLLIAPQVSLLESQARWESKLPAVLSGELEPASSTDVIELASYCALFDKKYVLAVRFVAERAKSDPKLLVNFAQTVRFSGWAVQAGLGKGADAADLPDLERARLRRQALTWLRESLSRVPKEPKQLLRVLAHEALTSSQLASVRDLNELAKLPPDERAEWEKFWAELAAAYPDRLAKAPPPRPAKDK